MRRRTLVIGVVLLGVVALVLFCCGGADRHASDAAPSPAKPPPTSTTSPGSAPSPPVAGDRALAPAVGGPSADSAASGAALPPTPTAPAASPSSASGASIVQAVKTSDPRDLAFLASIERELERDPPPEVHALVAARKRGASRAELASAIQRLRELELRVLAQRWLDQVAPEPR